jgi:putative ABC transport system ATP-binding protein
MNSDGYLLEAQNIGRLIRGSQRWLLRNLSFRVGNGDRVAIVGPTGSGKTLLLRSLALLDPIDEGLVLWRGQQVPSHGVPNFRRQVIYLHQRPALIEGTVESNLRLPFMFNVRGNVGFDRKQVLDMLQIVGRGEVFLDCSSHELSGGEGQLVALVRALQLNPAVLLLDEPTASVDAGTAESIEQLVSLWHKQADSGRAVLWVTHDREQSGRIANRVLEMRAGRLTNGT